MGATMYNPFLMQQIDALSLPSDTALVTFVPLLWEIQCTDTAGQPLIDPILPGGPGVFENAAELLTAAHTKGAGVWQGICRY